MLLVEDTQSVVRLRWPDWYNRAQQLAQALHLHQRSQHLAFSQWESVFALNEHPNTYFSGSGKYPSAQRSCHDRHQCSTRMGQLSRSRCLSVSQPRRYRDVPTPVFRNIVTLTSSSEVLARYSCILRIRPDSFGYQTCHLGQSPQAPCI